MHIPDKIIEALELIPDTDRGQALSAIIAYSRDEKEPAEDSLTPLAKAMFILAKAILEPRIRRRRQRRAKKESAQASMPVQPLFTIENPGNDLSDSDVIYFEAQPIAMRPKMSRAERRQIQRDISRQKRRSRQGSDAAPTLLQLQG